MGYMNNQIQFRILPIIVLCFTIPSPEWLHSIRGIPFKGIVPPWLFNNQSAEAIDESCVFTVTTRVLTIGGIKECIINYAIDPFIIVKVKPFDFLHFATFSISK